ncbi:MAG: hypothetical protein R3C53_13220 [Pirellulaceae bacterium]
MTTCNERFRESVEGNAERRWAAYQADRSTALREEDFKERVRIARGEMKLKFTLDTQSDLLRGIDWFERIAIELCDRFELEFYAALERIKANPDHFAPNHTGFRPRVRSTQPEPAVGSVLKSTLFAPAR